MLDLPAFGISIVLFSGTDDKLAAAATLAAGAAALGRLDEIGDELSCPERERVRIFGLRPFDATRRTARAG
jgi:hypothetical protein